MSGPRVTWGVCRECGGRCNRFSKTGICHSNPACKAKYHFLYTLRIRYSLTADDYYRLLDEQDGKCAICRAEFGGSTVCIDHDHACCPVRTSCGKCIRGLLCVVCNVRLGVLEDRKFVGDAEKYLTRHSAGLRVVA